MCSELKLAGALLPLPPAADRLEAAHAERPGFFNAIKKVL
jgi:hypothetical protein